MAYWEITKDTLRKLKLLYKIWKEKKDGKTSDVGKTEKGVHDKL